MVSYVVAKDIENLSELPTVSELLRQEDITVLLIGELSSNL